MARLPCDVRVTTNRGGCMERRGMGGRVGAGDDVLEMVLE
jgi:hypothetical protein